MNAPKPLMWDTNGLMPAVVQDATSGRVLTLAYVSRASLQATKDLGETVFFSRKRQELWHKGATSGHTQKVVSLTADCDLDALVIRVNPEGPACHTGSETCFFEPVEGFAPDASDGLACVMGELEEVIRQRRQTLPEGSYTAELFKAGRKRILQKVGEEATETIVAAMSGDVQETKRETADLLFHLLVTLEEMGISLRDIAAELRARR